MKNGKGLHQALGLVEHGAGFVLVVDHGERGVLVHGTNNPVGRLRVFHAVEPIAAGSVHAFRSEAYAAVMARLRARFSGRYRDDGPFGLRFTVPTRELLAAIAETDLQTGGAAPLLVFA